MSAKGALGNAKTSFRGLCTALREPACKANSDQRIVHVKCGDDNVGVSELSDLSKGMNVFFERAELLWYAFTWTHPEGPNFLFFRW